ncbi:MAG: winged helix-turn-helix domain-containing protein [Methanothrix sp.]|nr:winged helix-turn-helix domain-containing protein [Methanothrix sp.]
MSSDDKNEARGWESAEDHRFALEVLQLGLRRKMLRFIAGGMRSNEQIAKELDLGVTLAEYHLQMLEKALVIERAEGGWRATPTGLLYLKNVETKH